MESKIFYINLEKSKDRKKHMEMSLSKYFKNYERFSAINGNKIDTNIQIELVKKKYLNKIYNLKKKGKLGTFLSHILLWESIYKKHQTNLNDRFMIGDQSIKDKYVIIFEDDIIINNDIINILFNYNKYIPSNYDILYLGYSGKLVGKKINKYILKPFRGHYYNTNHGLFAYVLKIKSIPKLLKILLPIDNNIICGTWQRLEDIDMIPHIDWKIRHFYNIGINAYYFINPLIGHSNIFDSDRKKITS